MAQQIYFFNKNFIDVSNDNITITITDAVASNTGSSFVNYIRDRKNSTAWLTTGSTDAANTTLEVDWNDSRTLERLILIGHNFKAYTIKYWDLTGSAWTDFSTPISETTNAIETTTHTFTGVITNKIQIIVTGTMVVDADKILRQLICTEEIGQLEGWPIISNPQSSTNKVVSRSLSGKVYVAESIGAFSCTLSVENWNSDHDLNIIEEIYNKSSGVLMWLCGGDEDQFSTKRIGYRLEDIYFVRPIDEYTAQYARGLYKTGLAFSMNLSEAIL